MKVVLAFSGGLDTSYCVKYLSNELGFEVHAVTVNTGGFDSDEEKQLKTKAQELGVSSYTFIDETQNYYNKGVKNLLFGNVLKNETYPLSVSAERSFQAMAIAKYATEISADAIAHGSTGAGNDQVRFDMIFHAMCPGVEIITPIRDQQLSREAEIAYLKENGISGNWEKSKYSINKGLWGTSVGGKETLTSHEYLPEAAFLNQKTKEEPETIAITFEYGEPVKLNGKSMDPIALIQALDDIAAPFAIGRDIHVGDTIVGIKGRVGFEAAAALILIKAHHLLEKHVLTKNQLRIKDQLSVLYGDLMHEGNFLDPGMRDIEAFFASSQEKVSGTVEVLLAPYRFQLLGVQSQNDLMQSSFGNYGEMNEAWSADEARGFSKILSTQLRVIKSLEQ